MRAEKTADKEKCVDRCRFLDSLISSASQHYSGTLEEGWPATCPDEGIFLKPYVCMVSACYYTRRDEYEDAAAILKDV